MTINLLPIAMAATDVLGCNKPFQFLKYKGTTIDEMGRDVPDFEDPVVLYGSVQSVSNNLYQQLGLDLSKNYKIVFCSALMQAIDKQIQPDRIVFNNRTYETINPKDWYDTNGWTKVIMVELKSLRDSDNGAID